jgi:hypothetical protein
VGADDDGLARDVLQHVIMDSVLGADMERSCVVGETPESLDAIVDLALGRLDACLRPVPEGEQRRQADIVFLDENLHDDVLGSDLAGKISAAGFTNLVCVLTASSKETLDYISSKPGVDCAFEKGHTPYQMAQSLREKLSAKRAMRCGGIPCL